MRVYPYFRACGAPIDLLSCHFHVLIVCLHSFKRGGSNQNHPFGLPSYHRIEDHTPDACGHLSLRTTPFSGSSTSLDYRFFVLYFLSSVPSSSGFSQVIRLLIFRRYASMHGTMLLLYPLKDPWFFWKNTFALCVLENTVCGCSLAMPWAFIGSWRSACYLEWSTVCLLSIQICITGISPSYG